MQVERGRLSEASSADSQVSSARGELVSFPSYDAVAQEMQTAASGSAIPENSLGIETPLSPTFFFCAALGVGAALFGALAGILSGEGINKGAKEGFNLGFMLGAALCLKTLENKSEEKIKPAAGTLEAKDEEVIGKKAISESAKEVSFGLKEAATKRAIESMRDAASLLEHFKQHGGGNAVVIRQMREKLQTTYTTLSQLEKAAPGLQNKILLLRCECQWLKLTSLVSEWKIEESKDQEEMEKLHPQHDETGMSREKLEKRYEEYTKELQAFNDSPQKAELNVQLLTIKAMLNNASFR